MIPDLVRCSRAGDAFHYRWAARRCLRMVNPCSELNTITIEGSNHNKRSGEYVIDVAEYYKSDDSNLDVIDYLNSDVNGD